MEAALLEFPVLQGAIAAIEVKAARTAKDTTLLSLLMQAGENAVIAAASPALAQHGWRFVAPIADASLVEPQAGMVVDDGAVETARRVMEGVGESLGIPVRVKVEHRPRGCT